MRATRGGAGRVVFFFVAELSDLGAAVLSVEVLVEALRRGEIRQRDEAQPLALLLANLLVEI